MNGNTAAFTGRVTHDPEQRWTRNSKRLLQLNVAVDQSYVATEERAAPAPIYVRATLWGALAEELADQVKRGSSVYLEGRLTLATWTSGDGSPRAGLNLSAWRCDLHAQIGKAAPARESTAALGRGTR